MGGKKATTTSSVSIPPEVLARYNAVNTRAETAATAPYEAFGKTAADYVAQMNAQQGAGISDINATAGSYQPYMTQATTATQAGLGPAYEGIDRYMSPYIKNVADTTGAFLRQQQEQAQSGALGNAISSGAFGGDRAGIAAANLQQQNQMAYGKTMADIMNQGYTQALGASQADLARQLQGGSQLAGLGAQSQQLGLQGAQAKIAAGTMQQQTEQAGKDAMINQFMQEKGYPFQVAQFLANIATGTGAAAGSTTTTQAPRNWLGFASGGAVEGYASGGVAGPRTYSQQGVGGEGYVPAADLPVGQLMVADPPEQSQGKGTEEIIKMITMAMGAARGGAIDQRHGYALDGGVEDLSNRIRLDDALIEQFGGVKPVVSDGKDGQMPSSRAILGTNPQYPGSKTLSPMTAEQLRNRVNDPDYYDFSGFQTARNLANARNQAETNPANMGYGDGYNMGMGTRVHSYPPSPTTGVAPTETAPTVSMRPPARPEGLGAADAMTTSLRPMPRPAGLGAANVIPAVTAAEAPAVTPAGGVGSADVAADAMKTLKVTDVAPNAFDVSSAPVVTLGSETTPAAVDPIEFFNTKIIGQESGDNQFDKNGNPLTSSAGAVGAAQVMEGTGPEAARLAGLEWDKNRWLNDKKYNKALGQAYFLEQYRQFGSLDKAAAAYNAGPGALASAMDRALALGGSYLDYLPAETQNYVYSTTGMGSAVDTGGLGRGRQVSGDGLAGADMTRQRDGLFANDKPYEDRNAIGKFFYNPNGSLNSNAVMALLGGLAKGAEAQTISPLGGILSGLGGGMETYKQLLKQSADVAATNIESMNSLYKMYNNFMFTNPEYADMTLKQFADANGLGYMLKAGSQDNAENISAITGGVNPITLRETQGYVDTMVDGRKVSIPFMSDYASLNRLASQWKNAPEGSPQRAAALKAEETIKDIDAKGYTTGVDEQGQPVVVPVDAARAKTGAVLTDQQNVENTQVFRTNAVQMLPTIAPQVDAIDRQANIYSKTEAGALASVKGQIGALASALGVNIEGFNDAQQAALVQEALKEKARGIVNRGGGSQDTTDFAKGFIDAGSAGPNLEPDAVKKLLVIEKASLLRERDRLSLHSEWQKQASNPYDMNEYEDWFAKNYPLEEYTAGVSSSMPKFVGETGSLQKPHPAGSNASDIKVGDYFTLPDGKIGQREE